MQSEPDERCWTQTWVLARKPDYSFNLTKGSSAIQYLSRTSSPYQRWPSRSRGPFSLESVLDFEKQRGTDTSSGPDSGRYLSLPTIRQDLTQGQWFEGWIIVKVKGVGGQAHAEISSPAGLCWSSAHLVQCKLDEPCWMWTQTCVLSRMHDYNLSWAKRSSAIQCLSITSSITQR